MSDALPDDVRERIIACAKSFNQWCVIAGEIRWNIAQTNNPKSINNLLARIKSTLAADGWTASLRKADGSPLDRRMSKYDRTVLVITSPYGKEFTL